MNNRRLAERGTHKQTDIQQHTHTHTHTQKKHGGPTTSLPFTKKDSRFMQGTILYA